MPALDADETHRVNRVQLAILLHKTPGEIDAMPLQDVADIMEVRRGEQMARDFEQAREQAKHKGRRRRK